MDGGGIGGRQRVKLAEAVGHRAPVEARLDLPSPRGLDCGRGARLGRPFPGLCAPASFEAPNWSACRDLVRPFPGLRARARASLKDQWPRIHTLHLDPAPMLHATSMAFGYRGGLLVASVPRERALVFHQRRPQPACCVPPARCARRCHHGPPAHALPGARRRASPSDRTWTAATPCAWSPNAAPSFPIASLP